MFVVWQQISTGFRYRQAAGLQDPHTARAAIALNRAMEAWPWLARTQLRDGASLMTSTQRDDHALARQLIRDAEQLSGRPGMTAVASEECALLPRPRQPTNGVPDDLTSREVDVLRLIASGRDNKETSNCRQGKK